MATKAEILIIDMGSQYTRVIERVLRDHQYRSAVLSPDKASGWMEHHGAKAVIISGGDKSVYDEDAPQIPQNILDANVPILGICYGMQWLAKHFGGTVERVQDQTGYGGTQIELGGCDLFLNIDKDTPLTVWASHGDSVTKLPEGALVTSTSTEGGGIKSMVIPEHQVWGVQFHPEVKHTEDGEQMLLNFVDGICHCTEDWSETNMVKDIRDACNDPQMRVISGFSGGVDSTTSTAIIAPKLGDRLRCILVDAGHLRENEVVEAKQHCVAAGSVLHVIEAEDLFFEALAGVTDAEQKRKIFGRLYHQIFLDEAEKFNATHVVQGTLATDLIESGATGGAVIKSHHNVGHDWGDLGHFEPLKSLFKYEVRAIAVSLGLPDSVSQREPFPGPGFFIRMPGAVTKARRDILRWATAEVQRVVYSHPDCPEISQLVPYLSGTKIVGVKGDKRVYEEMVVVRPIHTVDYMTASSPIFSPALMTAVMTAVSKHDKVVGVLFDFNTKPPRTTEAE